MSPRTLQAKAMDIQVNEHEGPDEAHPKEPENKSQRDSNRSKKKFFFPETSINSKDKRKDQDELSDNGSIVGKSYAAIVN